MTKQEWSRYLKKNGVIKAQNKKFNKCIVFFRDTHYVIKNDEVVYTAVMFSTAKRYYNLEVE